MEANMVHHSAFTETDGDYTAVTLHWKNFYGDFGMIYGIIGDNGVLFPTTDVIDTYSFRALRQLGDFGMSSAVCLYQSALGFLTIMIFNRVVKKNNPEQALF